MAKYEQLAFGWTSEILPLQTKSDHELNAIATLARELAELSPPGTPLNLSPFADPLPAAIERGYFGNDDRGPIGPPRAEIHTLTEDLAELPPALPPQPTSVEAGVFGREENGAVVKPTEEEIDEITEQLTDELIPLPDGPERQALLTKYAADFGKEAARELDRWSRLKPEADEAPPFSYDPAHPWHYYHEGDDAAPLPLESIPPRATSLEHFGVKWPKNSVKRRAFMEQMLASQKTQLAEDEERYQDLVYDGVEALSRYDREIAEQGNDDLAWATAIALKYTHITAGRGRIRCLEQQLGLAAQG